jgi:hypothetical protein
MPMIIHYPGIDGSKLIEPFIHSGRTILKKIAEFKKAGKVETAPGS